MSEPETLFCPQCKEQRPTTSFECLPLDLRCNRCIPADTAMALYDARVQQAGQKISQILDASGAGANLAPVERMLSQAYDRWGGAGAFMEDVVGWIKDLAASGRGKGAAVNACMKMLALHAKVDRMKLEDDWRAMDDEQIRATLKVKMLALLSDGMLEDAKKSAVKGILGGND